MFHLFEQNLLSVIDASSKVFPKKSSGVGESICNVQVYAWLSFPSVPHISYDCISSLGRERIIKSCKSVICRSVCLIPKEWPLSQMFSDECVHACSQGSQYELLLEF